MDERRRAHVPSEVHENALAPMFARVSSLSRELTEFLSDSESAFLDTGKRLEGLAERSMALVTSAEQSLTIESEEGASAPAGSLTAAIGHMERHLEASRIAAKAGQEALSAVLRETDEVTGVGSDFQRIARSMRALATSLRVEDGRCGRKDGFDLVAFEVVKLGDLIAEKFHLILAQASSLHDGAASAHEKESEFLRDEGACAAALIADARSSLVTLATLDARTAGLRTNAVVSAREICRASNDILVLLQAHDIARQMLEHVVEALSSLESSESVPTLCRIQARQIGAAHGQLAKAYATITRDLQTVSAKVATIAQETQGFTEGEQLLDNVEKGVTSLMSMLRDQLNHEQETFAAAAAVVVASAGMERFIGEIAAIAHDVKVLALNSLVKAVKAGNSGAVFAILAEAVKDIATDVASNTQRVAESMRRMAEVAQTSNRGTRNRAAETTAEIENNLSALLGALRQYHDGLLASLRRMTGESATLGDDVKHLTFGLTRQAHAAEALGQAERELVAIAEHSERVFGLDPWPSEDSAPTNLDQYTMEAEREIHRLVADGAKQTSVSSREASPADDSNVEFF